MQLQRRRAQRHRRRTAGRAEAELVGVAIGQAQPAHHRHQRDVDHIVLGPAAIRKAGVVVAAGQQVADDAEPVLLGVGHRRDAGVQPQHFRGDDVLRLVHALDAGQEGGDQIGARQVGRRGLRQVQRDLQQRRQRRMGHIVGELRVARGLGGVEAVLVLQPDDHLVDQGHAQARHLRPGTAGALAGLMPAAGPAVDQPGLAQAGAGPAADHVVAVGQAAAVDLQRDRGDVLRAERVGHRAGQRRIGDDRHRRVDQVEDRAEIDRERILALADKHPSRRRAARNRDRMHMPGGVAGIVGNRLDADVVDRLGKGLAAGADLGQRLAGAGAAVAAHHLHGVGLGQLQVRVAHLRDLAGLDQRNAHRAVADLQAGAGAAVGQGVAEAELEAQVLLRVPVVVDVDLVERVRIEREVVRAAVGILQRQVVGDQRDEVGAAGFVAAEHVEVAGVDLRGGGDEGRLAVAGSKCGTGKQRQGQREGSQRAADALQGRRQDLSPWSRVGKADGG